MSEQPRSTSTDQRTLNHYFASYQRPAKPPGREGARDDFLKSDNDVEQIKQQKSDDDARRGATLSSAASLMYLNVPQFGIEESVENSSNFEEYDSLSDPKPSSTNTNSISVHKRGVSEDDIENDDSVIFMGESTPRPQKQARGVEFPTVPEQSQDKAEHNSIAAPPASQLSTLTSLGSTPSGVSLNRAAYVPSSQSDENYEIDEPETIIAFPLDNNGLASSSPNSSGLSDPPPTNELQSEERPHLYPSSDSESSSSPMEDLATILGTRLRNRLVPDERSEARSTADSKYSLANLKKQHDKDLSASDEMQRALAVLHENTQEPEPKDALDREVLSSIIKTGEGEEQLDKVMHAMDRTDAMGTKVTWRFFEDSDDLSMPDPPDFPILKGSLAKYSTLFGDRESQCNTFVTGFAEELLTNAVLPKALRDWLWQSAMLEQDEYLSNAYIRTLKAANTKKLFDVDEIYDMFSVYLHGKYKSLDLESDIVPVQQNSKPYQEDLTTRLLRVLSVFTALADRLNSSVQRYAIRILLRVSLDTEITNNVEVQLRLRNSIASLISAIPPEGVEFVLSLTGQEIFDHLANSTLQAHLVEHLPSSTRKLQQFRRNLALAFFLSTSDPLQPDCLEQLPGSTKTAVLSKLSKSPLYQITPDADIDYNQLAASIKLLDIGIDAGFSTIPDSPADVRDAALRAHDATVDALTDHLHNIMSRIVDCGAAHMARTEAKSVLERLINRLAYAVRSKPRPRRTVWDVDSDPRRWMEGGKAMMEGFVSRAQASTSKDSDAKGNRE